MFWQHKDTAKGMVKLSGPKDIPELVGRHMVVQENKDPNAVWALKGVVRPADKKKRFYCRVFNQAQASQAHVTVKDWTSLDTHPELVLWEGYFDKELMMASREKFVEPSHSPN